MGANSTRLPEAAALTSTGRVRSRNEDALGYRLEQGIFVVCDGMGGAAGGEIASRIAVDTVLERMCSDGAAEHAREALHEGIAEANRAVLERADREPGLFGMGTTLVAMVLCGKSAIIAHAGDSRCYQLRQGRLERRTHDHSLVDEQIRLGSMTREEAERSPFRSVITRAVGTQQTVTEEIVEADVEPGDLFLLCTDGLTREVNETSIRDVLASERDPAIAVHRLVEAANEAGGHDNITTLLVRIPEEEHE